MKKPKPLTPAHLKAFRDHYMVSQADAADLLGITRVTWSRWEKGHTPLPPYMIFTLRGLVAYIKQLQER